MRPSPSYSQAGWSPGWAAVMTAAVVIVLAMIAVVFLVPVDDDAAIEHAGSGFGVLTLVSSAAAFLIQKRRLARL